MLPVWIALIMLPILGGAERFNCRGRILGAYYADAKSGCKAFHVCVRVAGGGIRDFRFFCPPGTLFHQEAQTCTDWGDDDPLACPVDLYDGQFDLYKIGSGFDTKKLSSPGNRDEETEFGLQRAETGDRRLAQEKGNSANQRESQSDLRAAHSSDFFSGQRERGRDDPPAPRQTASRQSFRRSTTQRTPPTTPQYTTQYTTQSPLPPAPQPTRYETAPKRKLVRKRPIYASTPAPTVAQNTPAQQSFSQQPFSQQPFSQQPYSPQPYSQAPQQNYHRLPQNRPTTIAPANVPPQYKEEYVEVSRVAPKQTPNRYYPNNPTPVPFAQSSAPQFNKKDSLTEIYNYEAQSTPGFSVQNENRQPFKVRNSFSVSDVPREDFARLKYNANENRGRGTPTTTDYTTLAARTFATSTPVYKNFNSVSYEPEKENFAPFRETKQNYYNSPTTTNLPATQYTTSRSDLPANLNTIAYNTNIALNTIRPANYADANEDDGQYRLPSGEDDGQYRPELYERELLSGAHSLNIAASGNRLPEDQKPQKTSYVKPQAQTAAPRPFRPAPTSPTTTYEPTYTTTYRPPTTANTARTFDYFQTYTTTSRPYSETTAQSYSDYSSVPSRAPAPARVERPSSSRAPAPPTIAPAPPARPAPSAAPARPAPTAPPARPAPTAPPARPAPPAPSAPRVKPSKKDESYDYAYYDSDTGFSEYDHIEEFGKTKTRA